MENKVKLTTHHLDLDAEREREEAETKPSKDAYRSFDSISLL